MSVELMLAVDVPEVVELVQALSPVEISWCPDVSFRHGGELESGIDTDVVDSALEDWRDEVGEGDPVSSVVVATWSTTTTRSELDQLSQQQWVDGVETAFNRWFAALGAAARRVSDGGCIVAVMERPSPLDCAGHAVEAGMGDAVEALVRSLARSQGQRGVRVNAVTSPLRMVPDVVIPPLPALRSYPGAVVPELSGAVEMLVGSDSLGVSGAVVHVDGGRSWR